MNKVDFFETAYRFVEQLKGGPLRDSEKKDIIKGVEERTGEAFERIHGAIEDVLHTNHSVIKEKIKGSDELKDLEERLRREAYEWENYIET
jgi:hypothetical protein